MEQGWLIREVLATVAPGTEILIKGWVRSVRAGKEVAFLAVNDGSCLATLQVVAGDGLANFADLCRVGTGSALTVRGVLQASPAAGQRVELLAEAVEVVGAADEN